MGMRLLQAEEELRLNMKILFLILCFILINACTTIVVAPSDNIKSKLHSRITLIDNQKIRSDGFKLIEDHLIITEDEKKISIPRSDVHQIETVNRQKYLPKSLIGGAATGGVISLYEILTVAEPYAGWSLLVTPLMIISSGVVAGIGAYAIADRTYYEFNPLQENRTTEYSLNLLDVKSQENKLSFNSRKRFHFGLNLGGGYSRLPSIEKNLGSIGQGSPEDSIFAIAAFGKWIDHKTVLGGNLFMLMTNNSDITYFANRGIFSIGPQITHFPSRYGFYYKASLNYGVYFESIEKLNPQESGDVGEIVYDKSFNTLGASGSIGYAYTLHDRINLTAEISARTNIIFKNRRAGMLAFTFGLHSY